MKKTSLTSLALVALFTIILGSCQQESVVPGANGAAGNTATTTGSNCADCANVCGDIIVSNFLLDNPVFAGDDFTFNIEFKNIGIGAAFIQMATPPVFHAPTYQIYRSANATYDGYPTDPATSSSVITSNYPSFSVLPNQTFTVHSGQNGFSIDEYPYIIIVFKPIENTNDCNTGNNMLIRHIKQQLHP